MVITEFEEKPTTVKSPLPNDGSSFPDQSPPPYSPLPQNSSPRPPPPPPRDLPPDLAPANYVHIKEKNGSVKRKILLDLSVPRPPASALAAPVGKQGGVTPNLILNSHNGEVCGEVWLLGANREGRRPTRERVHLDFGSNNGGVKAVVHLHPWTVEPRPLLDIGVMSSNGSITVKIPRSFRGQMTLHTDNGEVRLSPTLAPRAALLSNLTGTHTYFVGERPSNGKWHTGESEDGDAVDGLTASSKNGCVKVSYDEEDPRGPGVLSSLFKAMGF